VRTALAEALVRRGLSAQARPHLRDELEALRAAEQSGEAAGPELDLPRLGSILLEADMSAEAAEVLSRALGARGASAELLRKLALARFRSGDRAGGVDASRRVLRLDPGCVSTMHNLALAALEQGRLRLAAGWIARGLRVNRHDDGLRRLRMRLWLAWGRAALARLF
jgi:tetratricopeptide (TPR) repeat protein